MDDCYTCGREIEKHAPSTATSCFKCRMEAAKEARQKRQAWMQAHAEGRLPPSSRESLRIRRAYCPDDALVWNE